MKASSTRRQFLSYSTALGLSTIAGYASPQSEPLAIENALEPLDEFLAYDALGLAQLTKNKDVSRLELVEIIIRRIEAVNPTLNFMTTPAFERAREKAGSIPLSTPFAGVPILIKDMIDVGGMQRTDGSRLLTNNVPEKNVAYIDSVEAAGLNILGMTNVPEFASLKLTDNDLFGATRNPWNLEYSAFTSSGGSAAAVGAGVIPMAHGTDGAGSCRLPASATGILGMKPSRYRMRSGEADGSHDIAKTNQVLSRSVRDSAALLNYTEDKSGKMYPAIGLVQEPSRRRLNIAVAADAPGLLKVEAEVRVALENTVKLMQELGHKIFEVAYPVDAERFSKAYNAFFAGRVGGLKTMIERASNKSVMESGLLTPWLASFVEHAATVKAEAIAVQKAYLDTLPQAFDRLFADYDVLMTPVSPVVCPKLDEAGPKDLYTIERFRSTVGVLKFTGPVNFGGNPAMSVPLNWGARSGLPIGTHFIAARGNDRLLYELAYALEDARPWRERWAPHSLKGAVAAQKG